MMAPKDVRPLLMTLSTDSLISMQEVPKSADRNPTRTFYLWLVLISSGTQCVPEPFDAGMLIYGKHTLCY